MIGIALSYALAYYMRMPTNTTENLQLHRLAVLTSIDVVDSVRQADLDRATPCEGWNLLNLLAHMTIQHHGFAAAARGFGADMETWRVESVVDAVKAAPARAYSEAAHDVLEAFAADGVANAQFALPEFGEGAVFPGDMAMGFHFVDYVVHGWDVAASLGVPYELPGEVIAAVLPLALAVPDGDIRSGAGLPFARAIEGAEGDGLERILRHLGRRPNWRQRNSTAAVGEL
jgi:uncharacterized protein (TIGR03086 family)